MAADGEIEAAVSGLEFVDALMLERKARREILHTPAREFQMGIDDVDSEHARAGKKPGQPRRSFARAATGVENMGIPRQRVASQQRNFLRPNGQRLRGQVSHHGLVGHLLGLWIQIGHDLLQCIPTERELHPESSATRGSYR